MDLKYDMGYSLRGVVLITEIGIPLFKKKFLWFYQMCALYIVNVSVIVLQGLPISWRRQTNYN